MDNLDKILDSLETEVNDGIDLTKRLANKSFGLFKNPIFLLTFFTVLFTIIGYKLYHYFKKQDDTTCQNFKKEKECPGYCVWDTGDESCSAPLKSGNACSHEKLSPQRSARQRPLPARGGGEKGRGNGRRVSFE